MQNLLGRRIGVPAAEWGEDDGAFYWGSIVQLGVDTQGKDCVGIQLDEGRLFHWPTSLVFRWLETQPMIPVAKRARVSQGHPLREGPQATQPDFRAHDEEPGVSLRLGSCERGVADAPIRLQRDAKDGRRQLTQGLDYHAPIPLVRLSRPLATAHPTWRRTALEPGYEGQQASECDEGQVGVRIAARPAGQLDLDGVRDGAARLPREGAQQLPRSCGRQAELCRAASKSGELEDGSAGGARGPAPLKAIAGEDLAACPGSRGRPDARPAGAASSGVGIQDWQDARRDVADVSCVVTIPGASLRSGNAESWNEAARQLTEASVAVGPTVKGEALSVGADAAQSPPCVGAGDGTAPGGDADPVGRGATARPQGGDQLPYSDDDATVATDDKNNSVPAGPAPGGDAAVFLHPTDRGQGQAASSGPEADPRQEQRRAGDSGSGGGGTVSTAAMKGARSCLPPRPRLVDARPGLAQTRPPASQATAQGGAQQPAAGTSGSRQRKQAGTWEAPKSSLGVAGAQAPVPRNGASALAAGIPLGRCIY